MRAIITILIILAIVPVAFGQEVKNAPRIINTACGPGGCSMGGCGPGGCNMGSVRMGCSNGSCGTTYSMPARTVMPNYGGYSSCGPGGCNVRSNCGPGGCNVNSFVPVRSNCGPGGCAPYYPPTTSQYYSTAPTVRYFQAPPVQRQVYIPAPAPQTVYVERLPKQEVAPLPPVYVPEPKAQKPVAPVPVEKREPQVSMRGERMFYFTAKWCLPCGKFEKNDIPILKDKGWGVIDSEDAIIRKIDVDQYPEFTKRFQIGKIPAFVIVKDGEEVARIEDGYKQAHEITRFWYKNLPESE